MYKNGTKDLWLQGYHKLLDDTQDREIMLQKITHTSIQVPRCRNALILNEDALGIQLLNPGILSTCILHGNMCMGEKLIQQLILAGLYRNPTGNGFTEFCSRVEHPVNNNILRRALCNAEIIQWQSPPNKKDTKKLGDVTLLGAASNIFWLAWNIL